MGNLPQYWKLYNYLRENIQKGVYHEGDLLPSENELSAAHNLTRPMVRLALSALVNDGFIRKHKGKGSIVTIPTKEIGILSIHGTTSAVGKNILKTKIVSPPTIRKWPEPFLFELTPKEQEAGCIEFERIRLVNNQPVFYDITYLPNLYLRGFCNRKFEDKSLFEMLLKYYQIEVRGGKQRFKAVLANEKISNYLEIPQANPILYLERKIETTRNDFSFYSLLYCNTDEYSLFGTF